MSRIHDNKIQLDAFNILTVLSYDHLKQKQKDMNNLTQTKVMHFLYGF